MSTASCARGTLQIVAFAVSVILGGCIASDKRLISREQGIYPFTHISLGHATGGTIDIARVGDIYKIRKFETTANKIIKTLILQFDLVFHAVTADIFIVQASASETLTGTENPNKHFYWFVEREGKSLAVRYLCNDISPATAAALGIAVTEGGDSPTPNGASCDVSNLDQLVELSRTGWRVERPPGRLPIKSID